MTSPPYQQLVPFAIDYGDACGPTDGQLERDATPRSPAVYRQRVHCSTPAARREAATTGLFRRARDLPVVALRISEIGVATDEELGVGRRLREPPARPANGLRQRIDFVGGVNGDDDVEPDGSATADPNPRTALARLALAVGGTGRRDA